MPRLSTEDRGPRGQESGVCWRQGCCSRRTNLPPSNLPTQSRRTKPEDRRPLLPFHFSVPEGSSTRPCGVVCLLSRHPHSMLGRFRLTLAVFRAVLGEAVWLVWCEWAPVEAPRAPPREVLAVSAVACWKQPRIESGAGCWAAKGMRNRGSRCPYRRSRTTGYPGKNAPAAPVRVPQIGSSPRRGQSRAR